MQFIALINGLLLVGIGTLMGSVAIVYRDDWPIFGLPGVVTAVLGLLIYVASSRPRQTMRRIHAFVLTSSIWLIAAIAGAVPLDLWGMSHVDAFFEAMSGITTTGSTVMTGLDETPHSILMWRAILQALGGIGFIVTGVALLPILKVGGMQLFRTESSEKGEKEFASAARFALATVLVYALLMLACGILYVAGGMSTFDAVIHALTTLSTGGYSSHDASFGHFQSSFLHYTATVFMLLGSLPFAWYIRAYLKGAFASEQVRMIVWFVVGTSVVLTIWLSVHSEKPLELAFRESIFNVVSVVTTTGYATTDYTAWGPFAVAVFIMLTAVGGCTGSTAGGAKMMRWIVFFRLTERELRRFRSPHAVFVPRYEGRRIDDEVLSGVVSFFGFYLGTVAALAIALTFVGLDLQTALSGSLTAVANVGPGIGPIIGPAGNFQPLDDAAKMLLAVGMYLGRLEIMTIFVLLTPLYWRMQ